MRRSVILLLVSLVNLVVPVWTTAQVQAVNREHSISVPTSSDLHSVAANSRELLNSIESPGRIVRALTPFVSATVRDRVASRVSGHDRSHAPQLSTTSIDCWRCRIRHPAAEDPPA